MVQDPRPARPYLYSDGQNIYNRVVLVYNERTRYYRYLKNLRFIWQLTKYIKIAFNIIDKNKVSDCK